MYNDTLVEYLQSLASLIQDSEERSAQIGMALAVDSSILDNEHLVVEAGTGTGKPLAYLLPFALRGKRIAVSTYTQALQDQIMQ